MINVAVSGVAGRMGSLVASLALDHKAFRVVGALESSDHPALGHDLGQSLHRATTQIIITEDAVSALSDARVLIEFTTPEATVAHARIASRLGVAMVIGTTGLTAAHHETLKRLARRTAIFWSPNMSIGVLILRRLLSEAAQMLTACGLDTRLALRISETHHIHKKDRPSGTAKQLAADLARLFPARGHKIPIDANRKGEAVGIHRVLMTIGDEQLQVGHEALSRRIFAQGALVVAKFVVQRLKRRPGYYTMDTFADTLWNRKRR